jgi:hypothetical protein
MRLNKRGNLGFPEAIMAAMIVTLSLTMYMGLLALNTADVEEGQSVQVDHRIFEALVLDEGEIVGDIEQPLISEMERHGLRGISLTLEVPGELGFNGRHIIIGNMDGRIDSERFIHLLRTNNGMAVPTVIEVAVCA